MLSVITLEYIFPTLEYARFFGPKNSPIESLDRKLNLNNFYNALFDTKKSVIGPKNTLI